jgi:hydroxyacylglutathione hydrolase
MYIEQLYTGCLSEAAYYIESEGEAVIIDPIRETEPYIQLAHKRGAVIKYIFETHFHADFVSGHLDLSKQTGAPIVYGPGAAPLYPVKNAEDGEVFKIGKITLTALHTPGHTLESTCWLLKDAEGNPKAIFTGDTLFVGDVGRPDLASGNMSSQDLASILYNSLNTKIKTLPDEVIVYPGHGAGSSCGKNLGPERHSTIGIQKATNYALRDISREQFIAEVTEGMGAPPDYFFKDAKINIEGYPELDSLLRNALAPLSAREVHTHQLQEITLLDTRTPDAFEKGHIPGSINVGLNGQFAIWAATVIDIESPLILICEAGSEKEAAIRLARVGFHHILGYLQGGIAAWQAEGYAIDTQLSISPEDLYQHYGAGHIHILDVRKAGEVEAGHIANAQWSCLSKLNQETERFNPDHTYYVHCAGGYRSMIAISLLRRKGFRNLINVWQGFTGISKTPIPIVSGLPPQHSERMEHNIL